MNLRRSVQRNQAKSSTNSTTRSQHIVDNLPNNVVLVTDKNKHNHNYTQSNSDAFYAIGRYGKLYKLVANRAENNTDGYTMHKYKWVELFSNNTNGLSAHSIRNTHRTTNDFFDSKQSKSVAYHILKTNNLKSIVKILHMIKFEGYKYGKKEDESSEETSGR